MTTVNLTTSCFLVKCSHNDGPSDNGEIVVTNLDKTDGHGVARTLRRWVKTQANTHGKNNTRGQRDSLPFSYCCPSDSSPTNWIQPIASGHIHCNQKPLLTTRRPPFTPPRARGRRPLNQSHLAAVTRTSLFLYGFVVLDRAESGNNWALICIPFSD